MCFLSRLRTDLDIIKQQAEEEHTDSLKLFGDAAKEYFDRSQCCVSDPQTEASSTQTEKVKCVCKAHSCLIV